MKRHGSEQKMYLRPSARSTTMALLCVGVPSHKTSWHRSQKVTMAVPCTAKSLPGSAAAQRCDTCSQMGSNAGQLAGYLARSHARSRGDGTTKSNHTDAR